MSGLSRRGFVKAAGAGAVLAGGGVSLASSGPSPAGKRPVELSRDPVLHAIRRLTYGATPRLVDEVRSLGVQAWVDRQLEPGLIPDPECERILLFFPTLRMSSQEMDIAYAGKRRAITDELQVAAIVRSIWSERQLFEVMVEFWSQHFNIYLGHDWASLLKTADDRDVVRTFALGRFSDLLKASARSPAMLAYLDNRLSNAGNPNENYARELLELHTVGIGGGYTEADIKNAARVLTGWTVKSDYTFEYRPDNHYVGPVRVMGWRHANATRDAGLEAGESLLHYLAHHPNTARFVCRKLCRRLVGDSPSPALVNSAANVFLKNDTQIAPVVRHIVASKEFAASSGAKFRRPWELLAASVRALGLRWDVAGDSQLGVQLLTLVRGMGHAPFDWRTPDGYPDVQGFWVSTQAMLQRWNLHQKLLLDPPPGLAGPRTELPDVPPTTAGALVDSIGQRLLFQPLPAHDRRMLLGHLRLGSNAPVTPDYVASVSPQLKALVLSSALHQLR